MSRKSKPLVFFLPLLLSIGLFSCGADVHHLKYAYAYGTTWEIHLYEGSESDALEIVDYVNATSKVLDPKATHCKDGVYVLNHEGEVEANPFLLEAIELGLSVESRAYGAYSITLGKLTSAWLETLEEWQVLGEATYGALAKEDRETSLEINGNHVTKVGKGEVDLGSLGKGLCLDHIKATLDAKGIKKYLINAGTSSLLIGENSSKDGKVKVSLEDAKGKSFYAKDIAVSNSSITRQRYEVQGKDYSHIIDPRSGVPCLTYDALCLKGDKAGYLDALSTAYFVLGKDYLHELSEEHIEYCLMKGGEVIDESPGFFA